MLEKYEDAGFSFPDRRHSFFSGKYSGVRLPSRLIFCPSSLPILRSVSRSASIIWRGGEIDEMAGDIKTFWREMKKLQHQLQPTSNAIKSDAAKQRSEAKPPPPLSFHKQEHWNEWMVGDGWSTIYLPPPPPIRTYDLSEEAD